MEAATKVQIMLCLFILTVLACATVMLNRAHPSPAPRPSPASSQPAVERLAENLTPDQRAVLNRRAVALIQAGVPEDEAVAELRELALSLVEAR